jgi:hypothetical protein
MFEKVPCKQLEQLAAMAALANFPALQSKQPVAPLEMELYVPRWHAMHRVASAWDDQ